MPERLQAGVAGLIIAVGAMWAQSAASRPTFDAFEVASIKPTSPEWLHGRYITMQGHQFVAKNHTLKTLIEAAYNLSPRAISGGPPWIDSDHYDILAKPPGEVRPNLDEKMSMLRKLLADRFSLAFHREPKQLSIYALVVSKNGSKLRPGTEPSDGPRPLVFVIAPGSVSMPGRNVTMGEFASVMQRAALDRPVVDQTGLKGRYDFDLEFTPDESQFGGMLPKAEGESVKPGLFAAMQDQLGLRLEATRGPVDTLVVDQAEHPIEN